MKSTTEDVVLSTMYHVDNEVRSKKDSCNAPKKLKRSSTLVSRDQAKEMKNKHVGDNDTKNSSNNFKTESNKSQFHLTSTPMNMAGNQRDKLESLNGLGESPDAGYHTQEKQSPGSITPNSIRESNSTLDESVADYSTPVWSMRYDYGSPDIDISRARKRTLKSKPSFDTSTSPYELAQKLADNLQKRPNLTMGFIVAGVIFLSTIIIMYRLSSIHSNQKVQVKTWSPSTAKGAQNGKYASIEYAHEKLRNSKQFQVLDEEGNLLGGKKASIAYAFDSKKKKEQGHDNEIDTFENQGVESGLNDELLPKDKIAEDESDDEEDYYEALQLLDDLKEMGDLLQQKSTDSEISLKETNEPNTKNTDERLKKLKAFENFATTKLRPLDLGLESLDAIVSNEKIDSKSENIAPSDKANENSSENVESKNVSSNVDNNVTNKKKRNKSFNKLYNAYSAKVLRLIEKKKNKFQNKAQNQKRSTNEEEDPFRFY